MGITHVVRGEEWLPSTPKHVYLYDCLGWKKPQFVHLPTVLNKEHKKLSKRNDDVAVEDFIKQGYLPEGLINYLALVGWSPEDNQEIFTLEELTRAFSFERVSASGGIFDRDKLNWVNAQHIKQKSDEELAKLLAPYLDEAPFEVPKDEEHRMLLAATFKENIHTLADVVEQVAFLYEDIEVTEPEALEYVNTEEAKTLAASFLRALDALESFDLEHVKGIMKVVQKDTGIKGKNLFMPIRAMASGVVHGPDLVSTFMLLGKEKLKDRVQKFA